MEYLLNSFSTKETEKTFVDLLNGTDPITKPKIPCTARGRVKCVAASAEPPRGSYTPQDRIKAMWTWKLISKIQKVSRDRDSLV